MSIAVFRIRFRDHGLALLVTAVLHIGVIGWLCSVEMQEILVEPKPKTIQLQFIQIPPPIKERPEPKVPTPIVEKKVPDKPIQKKQVEQPSQLQHKITQKVANSRSEKAVPVAAKQAQQFTMEKKKSTIVETEKMADTQPKQELITQMSTAKPTEPEVQPSQQESFDVKNYQPASKKAPAYPDQALDRKLEGDCTVVYVVNEKGKVENPKAQGDCHPMFVRPSIQAALNFKYQPRLVDGKPTSVPNVKNTFQYRIK
ncbi:energy transducer TonB [Acinetobacter sp. ACIN00229]|uniref:energy transducer TonB n=1 Tax=Acinetobacter sp. ACIN00229 TaxID=2792607 RepID=UPI0018DF114F|nr:energy transducer TonB [Acinetobacter sp. ACIN00229]MBI0424399.1 energy transducer TonB [Acinetobacter sp. ACIN00229]